MASKFLSAKDFKDYLKRPLEIKSELELFNTLSHFFTLEQMENVSDDLISVYPRFAEVSEPFTVCVDNTYYAIVPKEISSDKMELQWESGEKDWFTATGQEAVIDGKVYVLLKMQSAL